MKRWIGLTAGAIVLVACFLFSWPRLRPRIWQMLHGKSFRDGRFSIDLNPNWLVVTEDYGHQSLVRPFAYWPPMIDIDRLTIHQSEQCPDKDGLDNFRKIIGDKLFNSPRYSNKSEFVIQTKAGDLLCLSSSVQHRFKNTNVTSTICLLKKDSTMIVVEGMDPVREEALSMLPTLQEVKSCITKH
jgi:hypothetical protein